MRDDYAEIRRNREAIDAYLKSGGQVTKCPAHAQSTGNMRFNYATRKQREREESEKSQRMQEIRNG